MIKYKTLMIFSLFFLINQASMIYAKTSIKVGVYENKPLIFTDNNGEAKGIFADIIEHVASKEGWKIEYVKGTWSQCLDRLEKGKIDILSTIAYSRERDKLYDFTRENILTNWGQIYTKRDSDIKAIVDLNNKKVCVLKDDIHYSELKKLMAKFGVDCTFKEVRNYQSVLNSVAGKEADAGVVNRFFGMKHAADYNVNKSAIVYNPIKIHYAVLRGKNRELISTIDKNIKLLKSDERSIYFQSLNRWLGEGISGFKVTKFVKWLLITIGALVPLLIGLSFALRIQVRKKTREIRRELKERKQAEEALRDSEERYRDLFENADELIQLVDPDGYFVGVNRKWLETLGYNREDLKNISAWDVIHPDYFEYCKDIFRKVFAGESVINHETVFISKDGRAVPVEGNISCRFEDNKPVSTRGIFRDIRERVEREEALRKSEERYRSLVENTTDGYFICEIPSGTILFLNQRVCDIFGYTMEEGLRISIWDTLAPEEHGIAKERIQERLLKDKDPGSNRRIYNAIRKEGSMFRVELSMSMVSYNQRPALQGVVKDVTEDERLEKQMQEAQKMEAIGTLAGGIAHDFNNLLMGIQGRTSLMLMGADPDQPHFEHLKGIEDYVQSAANLTKQLLGFARGGKYEPKPININGLIEESSTMFGRTKKEINLYTKLQEEIWTVEADRAQIEQVLLNLYVNAWQAMTGSGDFISSGSEKKLYLETENAMLNWKEAAPFHIPPGKYVKLSIADTGEGMDEATQKRIFEPFFTTKQTGRGTGLGLASAYGIIKNHGGIISVISTKGVGTTFNIYLPASEKPVTKDKIVDEGLLMGTETILLVDDEEMIIDVGMDILKIIGYKVLVARGGQEAIEIYKKNEEQVDLIILDMIMPDMSGPETCRILREIKTDLKIIFSSGYSMNGNVKDIMNEGGCAGFIQKPYKVRELSQKIREVLGMKMG